MIPEWRVIYDMYIILYTGHSVYPHTPHPLMLSTFREDQGCCTCHGAAPAKAKVPCTK